MGEERRLAVPAVLGEVTRVCSFVVEAAEAAGLDERAVYHCQMAVDEWCTNIVEHGYAYKGENGRIEVDCRSDAEQLQIIIIDDSSKFDPTLLGEPRTDQPIEEREPGGLGWFLIKKIMDRVTYEYADHHNRLTMTKLITSGSRAVKPNALTFPSHELRGHIWVISPNGRLDSNTGPMLDTTLVGHLEANHFLLIVDMADVSYISSSGLKVLVSAWRKAQAKDGGLVLAGLTPRVSEVFHISGFDALFSITPTVQEAAAVLQRAGTI